MADAGTTGAPAAGAVPEPTGTAGTKSGAGTGQQPTAAQIAKWKADLGDGEQEYDAKYLTELAKRGHKAAQTLSLAERRAQEAAKREDAAKAFRSRFESKDPKQIRAALREMGVDERALANEVGREALEEMELTPEQKQVRELQRKLRERDDEAEKGKQSERQKHEVAEVERHTNELSELFTDVMQRSGLPRESAAAVFPRLASLYAAVEGSGGKVDPDLAAARVRSTLEAEHQALYFKPDGKGGKVLDTEAVKALFGEDGLQQIRRMAVAEWRTKQGNGVAPAPTVRPVTREEPVDGQKGNRARNFWKEVDARYK